LKNKHSGPDRSVNVLSIGTKVYSRRDVSNVDFSHLPQQFIVFDLETTGLDPTLDEIIEVGAIRVNRTSDVHETFEALVRPLNGIPQEMTQINGISQTMVDEDGEPLEIVLSDFAAFIQDLPLVSFNAEFDMAFLQSSAARAWPERSSYRLCDLAKDAGLSDEDAHRALGDCKRTVLVYTAAASILGTAQ
jgi:DNA polymerase III alpha subunit (gram-positive type)